MSEEQKNAASRGSELKWSGNNVRETFLKFFESKGHRRVRSSSLVPHGDPTLLFTNAGMNQFKDVFLGLEKRDYTRATTAQKCVRAGGKHNDLENVGFTKRHHTFFEMMGNFSFGDYFKKDAIAYAWELVTSPEWYGLAKDRLYITVFGGAEIPGGSGEWRVASGEQKPPAPSTTLGVDAEAKKFWLEENVSAERIVPIPGLKDNFWAMGDTGPCGPCSEIHYDMGPAASELGHGTNAPECKFPCDCGRYVEIWNLVFMQFNRDSSGALTPLPKPCVDTGMGLERVAAVLQGVVSNYDTDLFKPLMIRAAELLQHDIEDADAETSRKIIADHSRAATFLISDGVIPSNDGRGGVLRKIINRALVNMASPELLSDETFPAMATAVANLMGQAYPELHESLGLVRRVLVSETARFRRTMTIGLGKLQAEVSLLEKAEGEAHAKSGRTGMVLYNAALPGDVAFRLYDTFGVPRDIIDEASRVRGAVVDWAGFDAAMREQRERGRASWKGTHKEAANPAYAKIAETFKTEPGFYYGTCAKDCRIEVIIAKNGPVNELKAGAPGEVVLDRTTIYAESGGQVSDTGGFYDASETQQLAEVSGAYYPVAGLVAHRVTAKETLRVGDRVTVVADAERRARVMRNHTGTHLVHAALRNILGTHVKQAGSLNAPDRLRFDFSHFAPVDAEELRDIEQQVNEEVRLNSELETTVTSLDDALASGALAFFGDKYPEHNVRVVTIPDPHAPRGFYSKELCGGTHVRRVGDIGVVKIVSEESVAAGVRRIEAVTGIGALEHYQRAVATLRSLGQLLGVGDENIAMRINELAEKVAKSGKELEILKRLEALRLAGDLVNTAQIIKGTKVVVSQVENLDREALRQLVDSLRQKLGAGVVVLGQAQDGKVALIAGVTKDLTAKVHAGKLIQTLAQKVGGRGGGRPDLAEGGGEDTKALNSTLGGVPALLDGLL